MIRVQVERFDAAAELQTLAEQAAGSGAIVSFVGLVRPGTEEDRVARLELQQYPGFTQRRIEEIGEAARERFGLDGLAIIHRFGCLSAGEEIVFVGAAARHRRAAFEAVDYLMDRLKTEAPLWKREIGPADSRWIEARVSDLEDRERWESERQP